jgi:beta-alanine--pyruvate transaminase
MDDSARPVTAPNNLAAYWMPFTANRQFKAKPRLLVSAEGMHYRSDDGRRILDATAGLWCVNAGHARREIADAVHRQAMTLDYAPAFQMGHPAVFDAASRLAALLPGDLDHVFFANSGSEAVDTALKIALAYHRQRGEAARTRLIGRERGYHGVGFGGISIGGIAANRKAFGAQLPMVDHLPHTFDLERQAFSRGQPQWGAPLADALERIIALHDPSTIAAVIVEPVAGSTGVLVPPKGYLERLRHICSKYGILLIFDEVITGFGRLGARFGAEYFGVLPDMVTCAKGLTNGTVPMAAVAVRRGIYDAFMQGPENAIELAHGYTYSGHPLAAAAANAVLDIVEKEDLPGNAAGTGGYFQEQLRAAFADHPLVGEVRGVGLMGAVEFVADRRAKTRFDPAVKVGARVSAAALERGLIARAMPHGDILGFSPPLVIRRTEVDQLVERAKEAVDHVAAELAAKGSWRP